MFAPSINPSAFPQSTQMSFPTALPPPPEPMLFGKPQSEIAALLAQIGQAAAAGSGKPGLVAFGNVANNVTQGQLQKQFNKQLQANPNATPSAMLEPDRATAAYDQIDKVLSMQKKAFDLARTPKQAEQADRLFERTLADLNSQIEARATQASVAKRGATVAEGNLQLNQAKTLAEIAASMADQELNPAKKAQLEGLANYYNAMADAYKSGKLGNDGGQGISPNLLFNIASGMNASPAQQDLMSLGLQQNDTLFPTMSADQQKQTLNVWGQMLGGHGASAPQATVPQAPPPGIPLTAQQLPSGKWFWDNGDDTLTIFDPADSAKKVVKKAGK